MSESEQKPTTPSTALSRSGGRRQALVQSFRLTVVEGPDAERTFSSSGDRAVIGTHDSADFVLRDRTVSRFHCALFPSGDRVRIQDLESLNGTDVDGVEVRDAVVEDGALLTLGRTVIRFDLGDEPVAVELSERTELGLMVGRSVAMRAVFAVLERAAASDATVLLQGETGTGKEVAAESLHLESRRRERPFVVVDCGALPPELLESELFGHERGAFSGAVSSREGALSAAAGGTLFIDEIGELGQDLQPKLLRALERRKVKPVGGDRYIDVDVRVVAATNRDLRAEVNAGRFRPDLYYRLAVLEVTLPALRERLEDIPLLVERLLEERAVGEEEASLVRDPDFQRELARHPWPGNVRELRNYIERCLTFRRRLPRPRATTASEPDLVDPNIPLPEARERWIERLEPRYLEELLSAHEGNVSAAARTAGVGRTTLYKLLWRYRLK